MLMYGSQRDDAGTDMIFISGEKENGEVRLIRLIAGERICKGIY